VTGSGARPRRPRTPIERLEAEIAALRAENSHLRRCLAARQAMEADPDVVSRASEGRDADVRRMLRDRCSRNP
jgi:hypothetical protein